MFDFWAVLVSAASHIFSQSLLSEGAGVQGRQFGNEINGTLDKIRAITRDKSA